MPKEIRITSALEPAKIAEDLIARYHPHLEEASILYLFTTQERKKCDRVRLASAKKFSAMERYLSSLHVDAEASASIDAGADFLILFDVKQWSILRDDQRVALVDHECCHCARFEVITRHDDVELVWGIKGHDVEEFHAVLERHGFWQPDIQTMAQVVQLKLPLVTP
jgi:hypothetical protein